MMAKKRILSWLVAASLALSLLPAAALAADETQEPEKKTISDTILEPGKKDIIEDADKNAQDLIDGTYNALNPVEDDAEPAKDKDVKDILVPETDKDGNEVKDEDGNPVLVVKDSEENGVLTKADKAVENAVRTKTDVENTLTVEVETEEGEKEEKSVDAVIAEEAAKAAEAKTAVDNAAAAAEAAVANEDQEALDKAKNDAIQAVADATAAYNNAQNTFNSVVEKLLTEENDEQAIADKTLELLEKAGVAVPGEDATDEEKAAYEIERVNAENAAKLELANARIGTKYEKANMDIASAKTALAAAEQALKDAKKTYTDATETLLGDENLSDIAVYVDYFKDLNDDSEKANKVIGAYKDVDEKEKVTTQKAGIANEAEKTFGEIAKTSVYDRIDRDISTDRGSGNKKVNEALNSIKDTYNIIKAKSAELEKATDEASREQLKAEIAQAKETLFSGNAIQVISDNTKTLNLFNGTGVHTRYTNQFKRLVKNLEAEKALYEQEKAEKLLEEALSTVSEGLTYKEALDVVATFAKYNNEKTRDALKDAQASLNAQKKAAEDAKAKVDEATKAYEAAKKAVEEAKKKLNALDPDDLNAQVVKAQLAAAKGQLDQAKKDKEEAEEKKKEIDDLVIEIEQEIEEIITPDADDDDTDDDGTAIEDGIVPLALMPTRGELMNYLYVRAGSPAAQVSTFTDVPADHDFALAIGWAQANGIAVAYEDGTFDPDNFVVAADMTAFLTRYAAFANMEMPTLTTMAGLDDDAIVENADEILAEFFGD